MGCDMTVVPRNADVFEYATLREMHRFLNTLIGKLFCTLLGLNNSTGLLSVTQLCLGNYLLNNDLRATHPSP